MASLATYSESLKIALLCICWYSTSSCANIIGKKIFQDFGYPLTVTFVQFVSTFIFTFPILKHMDIPDPSNIPLKYWLSMILPLAFGKFMGQVFGLISIWKVPVSYAHTVKATLPFFTIVLTYLIFKEKQSKKVYFSIIPIIGGVIIATVTEIRFDVIGLCSALTATFFFSLQNIFSKKCLKETGIHRFRLVFVLATIASMLCLPLWLYWDLPQILADTSLLNSPHFPRILALLVIDGALNFLQNILAFSVIDALTPLSYAVANCGKRIVIVVFSILTLKNPVSIANVGGMSLAILGVFLYNKAKQDQQKSVQLPFAHGDSGQQNGGSAKHSNGFVNSSHTQENHFFIGASSPSRSKQPASVTQESKKQSKKQKKSKQNKQS